MTAISSSEPTRRDFLYIATAAVGAVAAAAALMPLVGQMSPDASTIAAGAPVEVDLAPVQPGQIIQVFWRSKPIFIFNRTPNDVKLAQDVDRQTLRDPLPHQGNFDGRFCPRHGSQYDSSGRIRQGPAPLNLPLPPCQFISASKIRIGETSQA